MAEYLAGVPSELATISFRQIKKALELEISARAFSKARDEVLRQAPGWGRVKASFKREDF